MTHADVKSKYPDQYSILLKDMLRRRYPRGESYLDLCQRIEQLIFDIECFLGPVFVVINIIFYIRNLIIKKKKIP